MARSSPARITRVGRRKGRQRPQELVRLRAVATHRGNDHLEEPGCTNEHAQSQLLGQDRYADGALF